MTAVDDLAHLPIEERQQERADMGAVDIGVRHDDDLVVAQLVGREFVGADTGAERGDQRADLLRRQHLVHARPLDVQDFAAERQYGLEFAVAALFSAAAGGIALDDEQFGFRRIAFLTIGELAGQRCDAERAFAGHFPRLARGFTRGGRLDDFADNDLGFTRMLFKPGFEHVVDHALDHRAHLGGDELVLGLRRKFRIGHFDRKHGGQPFAAIVTGERDFFLARATAGFGVTRDLARQRAAKAREMRATVALRDVVGKAEHRLVIAVVPPKRAFDADGVALRFDDNRLRYQGRLVAVEIFDEGFNAALVAQNLALLDRVAHVGEHDGDAGIEEGEFAQPVFQRGEIELRHGEGFLRRQKSHFGSTAVKGRADDSERSYGFAVAELHGMFVAVAPDRQLERTGQRIDDGHADAVQSAGDLVGVLVEFSAGVQLRHDHFGGRHTLAFVNVGRNTAAVVAHSAGTVRVEGNFDLLGKARQRLINSVVDNFVDHVMEAGAVIGVADIHTRPLADRVEPFQNFDRFRSIIGGGIRRRFTDGFGHAEGLSGKL